MKMPKVITGIIEFEIAKTEIENMEYDKKDKGLSIKVTRTKKMQKKFRKLIRLTSKYILKLVKLHYDTAKVRFDDAEFVVEKHPKGETEWK